MSRHKYSACIYCGSIERMTRDHVPPKLLFSRPYPNNLPTVPSCQNCNGGFQSDDEYLRLVLLMRKESFQNPEVQSILPAVVRSLASPRRIGFAKAFFQQCGEIEMRSRAGLYIGHGPGFQPDYERLKRSVTRIIRGFFFIRRKSPLPESNNIVIWAEDGLHAVPDHLIKQLKRTIVAPLQANRPTNYGNGVLRYWVRFLSDEESNSAWLLEFYGRTRFLVFTIDPRTAKTHFDTSVLSAAE